MRKANCYREYRNATGRTRDIVCTSSLSALQTRFQCCCLFGAAWGEPCSACPAKGSSNSLFLTTFLVSCFFFYKSVQDMSPNCFTFLKDVENICFISVLMLIYIVIQWSLELFAKILKVPVKYCNVNKHIFMNLPFHSWVQVTLWGGSY